MIPSETLNNIIQRAWRLRSNFKEEPHYPRGMTGFVDVVIDGEPKTFRVRIEEFTKEQQDKAEQLAQRIRDYICPECGIKPSGVGHREGCSIGLKHERMARAMEQGLRPDKDSPCTTALIHE